MLVLLYVPNSPKVIIATSTVAAGTTAFSGMLLTQYFLNCCNCGSNYVTQCGSNTFTV